MFKPTQIESREHLSAAAQTWSRHRGPGGAIPSRFQDPEFIALTNELEADILKQRLWYEENKDKSLL